MILRIDKLQIELPKNADPDPAAAAAVQELLGGKFGEMSTFNNYMFQSFNLRGREDIKPFYELIANITAEEFGHIELVSAAVNLLLNGGIKPSAAPASGPLTDANGKNGIRHQFNYNGASARVADSQDFPWTGNNVFSSGDLVLDLLHNYFLESGARAGKIRAYESTTHPVARRMIGYLLVRGGVHQLAYAVALEKATGVNIKAMLPVPNIPNKAFNETREWEAQGLHRTLLRFSPDDYRHMGAVFNGAHPEDGKPLEVKDGPPEGGDLADLPAIPSIGVPGYDMGELREMTARLLKNA